MEKKGRTSMAFSLHGIYVPHRKNTANMVAVRMNTPATVTIPMVMHIGKPATPVVKVGDHVDVGTLIAEQNGYISSPIYASVSGKVTKIADTLLSNGSMVPAITIESDGAMTSAALEIPKVDNREDLIAAIKASGIVGLGGAGFPTYVKFDVDPERIEELIINGAECEPYITSDTRTMIDNAYDIDFAIKAFKKHLGIKKIIIAIENNKKEAIAAMRDIAIDDGDISVVPLKAVYPQGGEKVMIYHTTGKVVPGGKLPIDVGCIVCNCSTMAAIGRYLATGMPLVERTVTVDGSAVASPKNVVAPIGTSLADVFEFAGGFSSEPGKVLYGGPMMGIAVPSLDVPILKNTNAVLAFNKKDSKPRKMTPCIRCGACTNTCPFGLNPALILDAYENENMEMLAKLRVDLCMECGCCAYGCPANRPIMQNHKLAKAALREYLAKEENSK